MFDLARHVFGRASNMVHQYASTDVRYKVSQDAAKIAMYRAITRNCDRKKKNCHLQSSPLICRLLFCKWNGCVTLVCSCLSNKLTQRTSHLAFVLNYPLPIKLFLVLSGANFQIHFQLILGFIMCADWGSFHDHFRVWLVVARILWSIGAEAYSVEH